MVAVRKFVPSPLSKGYDWNGEIRSVPFFRVLPHLRIRKSREVDRGDLGQPDEMLVDSGRD